MVIQEVVEIITRMINQISGPARAVTKSMAQLKRETKAFQKISEDANISIRKTRRFMEDNNLVMKNANTAVNKFTGQTMDLGQVTDRAAKSTRKFNFAWLSVMFAGMALSRVFGGLIKQQFELFGINELFGAMMTIVMLPIMELLLPLFFKLFEIVSELPDPIKLMIGKFILFGAVLGIVLSFVGQFVLALMGILSIGLPVLAIIGLLAFAFGIWIFKMDGIGKSADLATDKLVGMGISKKVLDEIGISIGELFLKLKEGTEFQLPAAKEAFTETLRSMITTISDMKDEWTQAGKKVINHILDGVGEFIIENPMVVVGAMVGVWFGGPALGLVGAAIGLLFEKLNLEEMDEIIEKGFEILQGILDGMSKNKDKIGDAINTFLEALGEFIAKNIGKFIDLGITIGLAILEGIGRATVGFGIGIAKKIKSNVRANVVAGNVPFFNDGGFVARTGLAVVHKGEQVIPANQVGSSGEIVINQSNNIMVSDKEEMERMINENNIKLVEEVKRQINI